MTKTVFNFPYRVLTYLGLWTINSKNPCLRFLYSLYQSWTFFYLFTFTTFLLWDLYFVRNNVHKSSTNLSATISILVLLWKNTQGLLKLRRLWKLQEVLDVGLCPKEDQRDHQIMRKAARDIKLSCAAVYLMGMTTMTAWLFSGFLWAERTAEENLPLPLYMPWEHHRSPFYELSLAFQIYGGYLSTVDILSFNLTIFGTIVQICAEFDVLLKNTEVVNEWYRTLKGGRRKVRSLDEEENKEVRRILIRNIEHHQKIIDCANESENCYAPTMLVQFVCSTTLLTFVTLDLILVTRELSYRLYPLIIFLLLAFSDIYLFCLFGSRLIYKSHELHCALYEMPWEAMNPSNREIVLVMLIKAQRPPKLTVMKFANIDLYSLLELVKIVYNILYLLLHLAKDR